MEDDWSSYSQDILWASNKINLYISRSIDEAEALISGKNIKPIEESEDEKIDLQEIFEEGALPGSSDPEDDELTKSDVSEETDNVNSNENNVSEEILDEQESEKTDT